MFRTLTPIFSIIIALALFFLFIQPTFEEIQDVKKEYDEYQLARKAVGDFLTRLRSLSSQVDNLSAPDVERLESFVPERIDEIGMVVDLEALIESHNMAFGSIAVSEPPKIDADLDVAENNSTITFDNDFRTTDISFTVIGTYEDMRSLLKDMERSLTLMEIMKLGFSSPASADDPTVYTITIRTYSLIPSAL
jgi:hypothetical protein